MDELSYSQKYHMETLRQNKALLNEDGSITTAYTVGVMHNGKIYNLPAYDRDTGEIIRDHKKLLDKYMDDINTGKVEGYPAKYKGDIKKHPANIAAQTEHEWIERNRGGGKNIGWRWDR